ncbi:hypothetical protein BN1723_018598 [Verticillium longisporum]|uniref:Uncharacterized protein n=1 Tax=Verticillium longisporum TaxID=100787 RepID=A0A0G4MPI6_VERLO|nr:hypothetical protein BN1723_018598 [Verticillium longisporum]
MPVRTPAPRPRTARRPSTTSRTRSATSRSLDPMSS